MPLIRISVQARDVKVDDQIEVGNATRKVGRVSWDGGPSGIWFEDSKGRPSADDDDYPYFPDLDIEPTLQIVVWRNV